MNKIQAAIDFKRNQSSNKIAKVKKEIERCNAISSKIKIAEIAFRCGVSKSFIYKNEDIMLLIKNNKNSDSNGKAIDFISKRDQKTIETIKSKFESLKSECQVLKSENLSLKEENQRLRDYLEKIQSQSKFKVVK